MGGAKIFFQRPDTSTGYNYGLSRDVTKAGTCTVTDDNMLDKNSPKKVKRSTPSAPLVATARTTRASARASRATPTSTARPRPPSSKRRLVNESSQPGVGGQAAAQSREKERSKRRRLRWRETDETTKRYCAMSDGRGPRMVFDTCRSIVTGGLGLLCTICSRVIL